MEDFCGFTREQILEASTKNQGILCVLSRNTGDSGTFEGFDTMEISIYIPWPFPPVSGVADNTKEQRKQRGFYPVLLAMTRDPAEFEWHCWSNTAHPPPCFTTYITS